MQQQHPVGRQALGIGGPDIVLRQHLQHRGACDAGDQRHVGDAQRHRRQDQALGEGPEPFPDRLVTLHRQKLPLHGEEVDQDIGQHEARHGEAQHGKAHDQTVDQLARLPRRQHADGNGQRHRHEQGRERQRHGRLETLGDEARHRQVGEDRDAHVALQELRRPDEELLDHRTVEAELGADGRDRLGRGVLAGDDRRRIARREPQQKEHEQRHHRHDGQRGEQAADDVSGHDEALPNSGKASLRATATHTRDDITFW